MTDWFVQASQHLHILCTGRDRRPGSVDNAAAARYVADSLARFGWSVTQPEFDVTDWVGGDGALEVAGTTYPLRASPYGLGVTGHGRLVVAESVSDLLDRDLTGTIVLARGALTERPLTPKGFPFYQVESDRQVIERLETAGPLAIIGATGRYPELAGAVSPFPYIEDGDFGIPAGHIDEGTGLALAGHAGALARITLVGRRRPARARNVVARWGVAAGNITVVAHIDSKVNTPGALDNAAGVTVVLLLAEMIGANQPVEVELLIVNGEDYYNAAGEMQYLRDRGEDLSATALAINLDAAGYRIGRTAFSLYGCGDALAAELRTILDRTGLVEGPQWWQSDHAVFALRGRPAVALTSEHLDLVLSEVVHSTNDTVEQVDAQRLVQVAEALRDLLKSPDVAALTNDPDERYRSTPRAVGP